MTTRRRGSVEEPTQAAVGDLREGIDFSCEGHLEKVLQPIQYSFLRTEELM